mmetsp:Transcript_785/g.2409  ORF Transcript_785/g.2409 Transcript_785/m.2409 type:complete len:211 (+) Transcript_785:40-672(+)
MIRVGTASFSTAHGVARLRRAASASPRVACFATALAMRVHASLLSSSVPRSVTVPSLSLFLDRWTVDNSSRKRKISSTLSSTYGFRSAMNSSFLPNFTPFAKFCTALEMRMRARRDCLSGGLSMMANPSGEKMAGHTKRRKKKAPTDLRRDSGNLVVTAALMRASSMRTSRGTSGSESVITSSARSAVSRRLCMFSTGSSDAGILAGSTS